jgi:hypothetical protein
MQMRQSRQYAWSCWENKEQHTPGPWEIFQDHPDADTARALAYIRPAGQECYNYGLEIASVYLIDQEPAQLANARLIAAAPELLAILQRFYAATYGNTDLIPQLDFEQARAAIAKAEGRAE